MKASREYDSSGIWAVMWRSMVYLPVALSVFFMLSSLVIVLLFLPMLGLIFLCSGQWWQALASLSLWLVFIHIWRRFRLSRFFEPPPSLL